MESCLNTSGCVNIIKDGFVEPCEKDKEKRDME